MARIENLNRQGIRETVWAMADYKPSNSPEAVARMNTFIRLAEWDVAKDAPFLFSEALLHSVVFPNIPMETGDTLEATEDPWVLKTTLTALVAGVTPWQADASWDGRQIHLKDPDDEIWHLFTIREAWTDQQQYRYISLDRPWPTDESVGIEWVVYQHPLRLPANVIEVKHVQLVDDETTYPISLVPQGSAEWAALSAPNRLMPEGRPTKAYRRPMRRLDAPAFTPVVATTVAAWQTTKSPIGRFEYCFTYVVGKSEVWELNGTPIAQGSMFPYPTGGDDNRAYRPFLESPPSNVSAPITATAAQNITVSLPDIDSMMGFADNTTERYRRAGIKKRVYRRRISDTSAAPTWEARDRFYLLAEVDGHTTEYTDDGTDIPEWNVPLSDNHGFELVAMFPAADDRYDVQVRAVVAPPGMETDTDTPHIPAALLKPLLHRVLAYLYESMGNASMKTSALKDYEEGLEQLRKTRGDLRPSNVPRHRAIAGVGGRGRGRHRIHPDDTFVSTLADWR